LREKFHKKGGGDPAQMKHQKTCNKRFIFRTGKGKKDVRGSERSDPPISVRKRKGKRLTGGGKTSGGEWDSVGESFQEKKRGGTGKKRSGHHGESDASRRGEEFAVANLKKGRSRKKKKRSIQRRKNKERLRVMDAGGGASWGREFFVIGVGEL